MIKANLKLSKAFLQTLSSLRAPVISSLLETQAFRYDITCDSQRPELFYLPSQSFAKMTQKKQEKMEHKKEREQADIPKEIDLNKQEKAFNKALENFKAELVKIKVGRLMPSSFEELKVPAHGEKAALSMLCQIVVKNATTIQLNVFEEANVPAIIKTVEHADLNIQVKRMDNMIICTQTGGNTKEAKEAVVKSLKAHIDQFKNKVKDIRADGVNDIKKYKKFMSEDVIRNVEKEINTMHSNVLDEAEKVMKAKEKEIMS